MLILLHLGQKGSPANILYLEEDDLSHKIFLNVQNTLVCLLEGLGRDFFLDFAEGDINTKSQKEAVLIANADEILCHFGFYFNKRSFLKLMSEGKIDKLYNIAERHIAEEGDLVERERFAKSRKQYNLAKFLLNLEFKSENYNPFIDEKFVEQILKPGLENFKRAFVLYHLDLHYDSKLISNEDVKSIGQNLTDDQREQLIQILHPDYLPLVGNTEIQQLENARSKNKDILQSFSENPLEKQLVNFVEQSNFNPKKVRGALVKIHKKNASMMFGLLVDNLPHCVDLSNKEQTVKIIKFIQESRQFLLEQEQSTELEEPEISAGTSQSSEKRVW